MTRGARVPNWMLPAVCVLCGVACAVLAWGGQSEDHLALSQQLKKFQALNEDQRHSVRLSLADFESLSESRKAEINAILAAVQTDQSLRDTLGRYSAWWSALDQSDFDAFQEMNSDDRLTFARSRMNTQTDPSRQIVIEFGGPVSSRLPPLHMTIQEFGSIITEALSGVERPPALEEELRSLSSEQQRTLRLALWIFESFPNQRESAEADRRGKQLQSAILNNVKDPAWKTKFAATVALLTGKPYERGWMFTTLFSILAKATMTLGDDLHKQFPVTDQQIKDAFASLEDKPLQQSLMTMSANEARTRLQFLAQTAGDPTPEAQLLVRYIHFAKERERILRFATFGFGGPGSFPPDRGGGPSGPRENRRGPSQDGGPRRANGPPDR